jgi:hypothetical protein
MLFILSFLEPLTPTAVKSAFLEQRREVVSSIFKGLSQDSYSVVRKVLETCWVGLWSDARIKRTLKVGLFDETTLLHVSGPHLHQWIDKIRFPRFTKYMNAISQKEKIRTKYQQT